MKFYPYIFWLLIACSLAISFTNNIGIFDVDYMTAPEGSTYELTDFNGTADSNTTPMDDVSLSVTGFFTMLSFLKDLAWNAINLYPTMRDIFHIPWQISIILETVIAVSWAVFFMQILGRFTWSGTEG